MPTAAQASDEASLARARGHFENWYRPVRSKRPLEEQAFWDSLADHSFDLGSSPIAVRSLGDGPNILLLHGVSGRGSQFSHIARTLADRGWRALLVDIHGHDDRRARYFSIEGISQALIELTRREGPLRGLVAHSMGNLWAWYALARGLRVDRLASLSGVFSAAWVFEHYQQSQGLSDQDMNHLRSLLAAHEGAEALPLMDPSVVMSRIPRPRYGLIIHGVNDEVVPVAQGRAYASTWSDAAYVEISQASHGGLLGAPAAVAAVGTFFGVAAKDGLRDCVKRHTT